MALPLELVGRDQPGDAGTEDEHSARGAGPRAEPRFRNREHVGADRLVGQRLAVAPRQQLVLQLVNGAFCLARLHHLMLPWAATPPADPVPVTAEREPT